MYFALEEDKDVEDIKEKTRTDFEEVKALNSTHPSTQLDKMAIELLERFSSLSHSETVVLKLALSHIVSFFDDEHLAFYKNHIKNDEVWSLWEDKKKKQLDVEEEKKKIVEDVFGAVVKEAKQSLDHALKFVLKEQLELLDKNERKTFKYQMLEAASYLLHNMEDWESNAQPSEAEVVNRVSGLLRIFFNDSDLKIKIGETTADCTKANRVHNESQFSGSNSSSYFSSHSESTTASNVSGRKIDMRFMADNGIEVALCEFKRNTDRRKLTEQQGKCCRLNVALLEDLKTIDINDRIIAITWGGMCVVCFIDFFGVADNSVSEQRQPIEVEYNLPYMYKPNKKRFKPQITNCSEL
ncbi:uncharacterized protein B0P05DRAFT_308037 [Gilbertella persicaria]|uniref:uncharacterized protein n=1 Tax=Gilbertella persicaria TaxID=101096 RepID=UPI00222098E1|nr:uncharacterized protein B0P05DRAFT_308037 [Gilbertella persicaria]KAI8053143.1 hypothetical protein B0P05DRAFT_308037 [Gilbertella persicaria]